MKEKFCCFTGHRKINQNEMIEVVYRLGDEIEGLIDMGVNNFISGGALGFDTIAALSVILLRDQGYRIRLIMALPCIGQDKLWNEKDREIYALILKYADEVRYIYEGEYKKDCMRERNKYMVDNSSYCISYLRRGNNKLNEIMIKRTDVKQSSFYSLIISRPCFWAYATVWEVPLRPLLR